MQPVQWSTALKVMAMGLTNVFVVLFLLMFAMRGTGKLLGRASAGKDGQKH